MEEAAAFIAVHMAFWFSLGELSNLLSLRVVVVIGKPICVCCLAGSWNAVKKNCFQIKTP